MCSGLPAPCGPLKPASEIGHPKKGRIYLKQNGTVKQDGDLEQMIWDVPEIIEEQDLHGVLPSNLIFWSQHAGSDDNTLFLVGGLDQVPFRKSLLLALLTLPSRKTAMYFECASNSGRVEARS